MKCSCSRDTHCEGFTCQAKPKALARAVSPCARRCRSTARSNTTSGCPPLGLQVTGLPLWDESHDFEGWFLGSYINLKEDKSKPGTAEADAANGQGVDSAGTLLKSAPA